jgi:wobble nucleotide-excising tRNase
MDQELVNSAIEIEQRAADAKSASVIQKLRLAYIALAKKVQDLEMRLANDKKEMYEDPIVCHAMHLNS